MARAVTVKEVSHLSLPRPILRIYLDCLYGNQLAPQPS